MTNTRRIFGAVAVAGLIAGCSRSDNTTASSEPAGQASTSENRDLAPSSRDTRTPNQVYPDTNNPSKAADNTARNVRDRDDATLTPGDQGNSASDRAITQRIRRSLSTNDQFSVIAKNIKIITVDGKVTLRGPVKSAEEQQAIVSTAQKLAGPAGVDNQLEVKAANQ
jgi:hypothetical protein